MKERTKNQSNTNIEWTSTFEELGVSAKFLNLWNRATAHKLEIRPSIFIDVWPIDRDKQMNMEFMHGLIEEILKEISERVLIKDGKPQYEVKMGIDMYDEESKILGLVATDDFDMPPSINELPL